MGIVHVLTGPDHLSAIATLSVNVGNFRAFWYGIRWGFGHSIGLVVVGTVFIALENVHYKQNNNGDGQNWEEGSKSEGSTRVIEVPEQLENLAACFVGLFMIALGCYNLYWAQQRRKERKNRIRRGHCHHRHCHHLHDEHDSERTETLSCDALTATKVSINNYGNRSIILDDNDEDEEVDSDGPGSPSSLDPMGIAKDDGIAEGDVSKKFLSLWVGVFHGVAGPGGVLGVVPAVRLHNVWHSVAYLGSFCASSIAVMGCFAALYGSLSASWTKDNDRLAYGMEVFSASLSVLVGCTWLVLLYLGILDDVFP
jgi:hypothetical protein